jgi:2-methylisocitrate lyase-like PEP mutase family enzyme
MVSASKRLRTLMQENAPVVAPGGADPLTAKLIEQAGFAATHFSGGALARGLGQPDFGQLGMPELIHRVSAITEVCTLPIIVDVDSGFGGPHAFSRAVRLLTRLDVAALHIEDQEVPRRSRDPARNLLEPVAMVGRIRAGLAARGADGPLLIARTDSAPSLGLDTAIDRVNRYIDAGADVAYVEFIRERSTIEAVARRVIGPKLISVTRGETTPLNAAELGAMGFSIVIFPADAQLTAIHAMRRVLNHIHQHGTAEGFSEMTGMAERNQIVGTTEAKSFEEIFLPEIE